MQLTLYVYDGYLVTVAVNFCHWLIATILRQFKSDQSLLLRAQRHAIMPIA